MTFKTFYPKRGLVRYQLKQFWWASAAYGLILFLIGPFMLLSDSKEHLIERAIEFPSTVGNFLMRHTGSYVLLIVAAVIIGVCVCRFMQTVRSATLFHAMPVTRGELYGSMLVSGFVLLAVPLAANTLILLSISLWGGYLQVLPPLYILDWFGGQLLTGTSTLCFCILLGVLCGGSVAQVVFAGALCLIPIGVFNVVSWMLEGWLFGFTPAGTGDYSSFLLEILPLYQPQYRLSGRFHLWIAVLQGIYILLFGGLGFWAYERRDAERAGDVVVFSWIRPVFLYGTTACVMLAGSFFVRCVSVRSYSGANVLLMLLFALLGYAAAKMLLQKSFRIAKYYKGYVVFAVLVLLAYFAVDANIFGYGMHVPQADKIEAAYVGPYYHTDWALDRETSSGTDCVRFFDAESVEAVRRLQQQAIDGGIAASRNLENHQLYIGYSLANGRQTVRYYRLPEEEIYAIMSMDTAKDSMYPVFRKHPERIRYIAVNSEEEAVYEADKEELIACVRKDLQTLSYAEISGRRMKEFAEPAASDLNVPAGDVPVPTESETSARYYTLTVNVRAEDGTSEDVYFEFNTNFTNTIEWIKNHGYRLGGK